MLSMSAGSLGLLACDDGETKKPSEKVESTTSDPVNKGGADDPGHTTKAEPTPEPEPEKDIYGGPRMMEGGEPEPGPQPTIYGGPRMMDEPKKPKAP